MDPVSPKERHWTRWAIGIVAAVAVVVVGGPFVYIHFIEGKAAAPLTLANQPTPTTAVGSTSPTSSSSASASSADGTWKVAGGSQAGYRIKETLFGQSNTAVGRTSSVTGSVTIQGTDVSTGSFSVDMTTVASDRSQRDGQFQGRIMETSTYPKATFTLTKPIQLGTLPADGVTITATAIGSLMLHGTTRPVTFTVMARRTGSTIQVSGSIPITFADWKINNPSGGPASTEDHGILEFLLNFSPS